MNHKLPGTPKEDMRNKKQPKEMAHIQELMYDSRLAKPGLAQESNQVHPLDSKFYQTAHGFSL